MKRLVLTLIVAFSFPTNVSAQFKKTQFGFWEKVDAFTILAMAQCHENAGNMTSKEANSFAINELRKRNFSFNKAKKYLSNEKVKSASTKLSSLYQEKKVNCYSKAEIEKVEKEKGIWFFAYLFEILR